MLRDLFLFFSGMTEIHVYRPRSPLCFDHLCKREGEKQSCFLFKCTENDCVATAQLNPAVNCTVRCSMKGNVRDNWWRIFPHPLKNISRR
ncbi:hypothetical protein I7I48_09144 [Histoplasma ohiense]|nr:hypothetical protein I7I48_09144 [Histoplasma ohiense (nom. inval.)]